MSLTHRVTSGLLFLALCGAAPLLGQTSAFATVSAASYQPAVAPTSLATIFGSGLASSTASATLDASGKLPTQLAGTTVEVNGEVSPLIYVSASQINFVVPDDTTIGLANIVVRTSMGSSQQGTVQVGNTAPALFSLDASGQGPGAILNAVTFTSAPFLVETSAITGADKRTRLAVYATGIRYAGNPSHDPSITNAAGAVTLFAHDASGNPYTLEYAGAAPGFFGLDQLNIVLPPELDGAGIVSLVVSTDTGGSSNTVTFQVNSLPPSDIHLAGVTLSPTFVAAGGNVQATVSLNGRAPVGGVTVAIRSNNPAAQVPFSATIPQGQASTQFTFGTMAVNTTQNATITAQAGSTAVTAALEIDPANSIQLLSFTAQPAAVQGGLKVACTVTLNAPAPASGVVVGLTSDNPAINVPATITVPFNQQSATISIPTPVVTAPQTANLTASFGHSSYTAGITINPPFTLTLSNTSVTGGDGVTGAFTLTQAPAFASSVTLKSSDPAAQIQPLSLPLAASQTTASFTVTTIAVTASKTISITASSSLFSGIAQTVSLIVSPPGSAQLQGLSLTPSTVSGGQQVAGLVTLNGPAPISGLVVTLKTSDVRYAQLAQQFVLVPPGQGMASFLITTSPVTSTQKITITATVAGGSESAVLTVQ